MRGAKRSEDLIIWDHLGVILEVMRSIWAHFLGLGRHLGSRLGPWGVWGGHFSSCLGSRATTLASFGELFGVIVRHLFDVKTHMLFCRNQSNHNAAVLSNTGIRLNFCQYIAK